MDLFPKASELNVKNLESYKDLKKEIITDLNYTGSFNMCRFGNISKDVLSCVCEEARDNGWKCKYSIFESFVEMSIWK